MEKGFKNSLRGAGSILELWPVRNRGEWQRLYQPAPTDVDALRGDWERVGLDLQHAIDAAAHEQETK